MSVAYRIKRALARARTKVLTWVGERRRPFRERREVVQRKRSATWQISIATIAATLGAASLGYLAVQLFFLPETVAMARLNRVPDITGLDLEDARKAGEAQGYVVVPSGRQYSREVGEGDVLYQIPPPDSYLASGDTLWVLVSLGAAEPVLPDLAGLEPVLARRVLRQLGLETTPTVRRAPSDLHPQGTVIETIPPAGTPIDEDSRVTLILSRGGTFLQMPDVTGLPLAAARDTLDLYNLIVGEVAGMEGEQVTGEGSVVVVEQDPSVFRRVRAGSAVKLKLGEARPTPRRAGGEAPPEREPLPPPGEREEAEPDEEPAREEREEPPADERPAAPAPRAADTLRVAPSPADTLRAAPEDGP